MIFVSERISKYICHTLFLKNQILEDDIAFYEYCITNLFDKLLYYFFLFSLGLVIKQPILTFFFIISLPVLKRISGGAHASNSVSCTILSFGIYFVLIFLSCFSYNHNNLKIITLVIIFISIIFLCPTDCNNKRLSNEQKTLLKKKCIIYIITLFAISIFLFNMNKIKYFNMIFFSSIIIFFDQFIGKFLNRKEVSI